MRLVKLTTYALGVLLLSVFLPGVVMAGVSNDDLPAASTWYFHADLKEMRNSSTGAGLYSWLENEVFADVLEESGIDLGKEVDQITAFSAEGTGAVMVVDGRFSQQTRDKAMLAASTAERFDTLKSGSGTYYHVKGDNRVDGDRINIEGIDNEFYFTFDVRNKLVMAAKKEQIEALMKNKGRIVGNKGHSGALFVLTAERSLIQAGLKTDEFDEDDGGFESNIMRNTRHIALMVADVAGKIAIEAQLEATAAETAQSLASIVRGLIALQAFSQDMDPRVAQFLQGTRVDVKDSSLKISVALSPETIAAVLDEV